VSMSYGLKTHCYRSLCLHCRNTCSAFSCEFVQHRYPNDKRPSQHRINLTSGATLATLHTGNASLRWSPQATKRRPTSEAVISGILPQFCKTTSSDPCSIRRQQTRRRIAPVGLRSCENPRPPWRFLTFPCRFPAFLLQSARELCRAPVPPPLADTGEQRLRKDLTPSLKGLGGPIHGYLNGLWAMV